MIRCLLIAALLLQPILAAKCSSNEYCPQHWVVARRPDQSAWTCDPIDQTQKCQKPHNCVRSKCGISFCCAHVDMLARWQRQQEVAAEIAEDSEEENDEL